jgi:putative ABC transport system substrate-binding protein
MRRRRAAVLAVMAAAAWLALADAAVAAAGQSFRIMMVLRRGCEDACKGFQDYFRAHGIVIDFVMRDIQSDPRPYPELVAEARARKVDLVVTWGTAVTLGMVGSYGHVDPTINLDDIPVLFMIVPDPVPVGIVPSLERPGRNVTGTLFQVPDDVQMRAIRSYLTFRKIGMIYNTDEINAVVSVDKARAAAAPYGVEVVARQIPNGPDGKPIAASIPGLVDELADAGVDLIYFRSGSFIMLQRDAFTNAALKRHIPVAVAEEVAAVDSNALLGLVCRYYDIGTRTAMQATRILLDHEKPAEMPIEGLSRFSFIVNMDAAHKLGLYPPMSIINIIKVVKASKDRAG